MNVASWTIDTSGEPLIAVALHAGHAVRPEVARLMTLDEATRRREEDAYTERFTEVGPSRIVGLQSRFEVDLNRPVEEAICTGAEDCWNLEVWSEPLPPDVAERSRQMHAAFYEGLHGVLDRMVRTHGGFVVFDCHSFNHRRRGPEAPPDDPALNPEVNVGTGSLDRDTWGRLVDRFIGDLGGRGLDVRENVKFRGRQLARFVHENFPGAGCCLAIEFKKTYMDEWTDELDPATLDGLVADLASTVPGVMRELARVTGGHEGGGDARRDRAG